MNESQKTATRHLRTNHYILALAVIWTVLVGSSLSWYLYEEHKHTLLEAQGRARENIAKDLVFRSWATSHGGVYVPATEETPPNPYLSHVPERDVKTPSGRLLTLINPAYMMRLLHEFGQEQYDIRGHITSLNPLNPRNVPDSWEAEALRAFERGKTEVSSVETKDGKSYLRLMRPLITERGCLKCHAAQGYKEGDIRGGISVSVPFASILAIERASYYSAIIGYIVMWVLGLVGMVLAGRRIGKHIRERELHEEALRQDSDVQRVLNRIMYSSQSPATLDEVLVFSLDQILSLEWLSFDGRGAVFIRDDTPGRLVMKAQKGIGEALEKACALLPLGKCLCGRAAEGAEIVFSDGVDDRHEVVYEGMLPHGHYCVPIMVSGIVVGVLNLYTRAGRGRQANDEKYLRLFVDTLGIVIARKEAEGRLQESEERYRRLVEGSPDMLYVFSSKRGAIFYSARVAQVFGYPLEHLYAHPFLWRDSVHPDDDQKVAEAIREIEAGRSFDIEYRVRDAHGEWRWLRDRSIDRREKEGEVSIEGLASDITERKRAEAEKEHLQGQIRQAMKMESVGTLAGGIAHDFNNALTGIVGFGELLRNRMAGDEQALHDLDEILRCADRATTLTRQLLTYARRQVIEPVNLNLSTLVADLMKLIGKVVGEHIEVKTSLEKNVPTIHADRGQIEQVVMNLCLNARDAMPEGGRLVVETGDVYLDEEYVRQNPYMRTGRYALLTVSDTGIGMDEKTRERVFEPFFTTKGPDKGTGLGLAMVYGIVKQHGGFIHLYSEPGKGTAFKVYFPAIEAQPDAVPTIRREEIVRGGMETILLAEDEEAIRSLIERTLKELGYNVLVARNGEEAIEIFRQNKEIVLAVLDVVMPRKGGKEAFEEMHKQNPRLKVIFMSGYSANGIHDSFVLIAGMPFLQKPFGPTILARKIREVLDTQ
jgi:PAS domain S-box-containing protein